VIYLWVDGEGWEKFDLADAEALKERGIKIGYGAKPICIYIVGSRFPVCYWGENRIDIGCKSMAIDKWLGGQGLALAEKGRFAESQAAEYRRYVEFIKSIWENTREGK